jgi:hypothetical protein
MTHIDTYDEHRGLTCVVWKNRQIVDGEGNLVPIKRHGEQDFAVSLETEIPHLYEIIEDPNRDNKPTVLPMPMAEFAPDSYRACTPDGEIIYLVVNKGDYMDPEWEITVEKDDPINMPAEVGASAQLQLF